MHPLFRSRVINPYFRSSTLVAAIFGIRVHDDIKPALVVLVDETDTGGGPLLRPLRFRHQVPRLTHFCNRAADIHRVDEAGNRGEECRAADHCRVLKDGRGVGVEEDISAGLFGHTAVCRQFSTQEAAIGAQRTETARTRGIYQHTSGCRDLAHYLACIEVDQRHRGGGTEIGNAQPAAIIHYQQRVALRHTHKTLALGQDHLALRSEGGLVEYSQYVDTIAPAAPGVEGFCGVYLTAFGRLGDVADHRYVEGALHLTRQGVGSRIDNVHLAITHVEKPGVLHQEPTRRVCCRKRLYDSGGLNRQWWRPVLLGEGSTGEKDSSHCRQQAPAFVRDHHGLPVLSRSYQL